MKSKILIIIPVFLICGFGIARFCHRETAGFRISKITQNGNTDLPLCNVNPEDPLFNQPFRYFNRGRQSFAFLSEDGKTVLKLFSNRHQENIFWYTHLPLPPFLHAWKEKKLAHHRNKHRKTFESYHIAFQELKEETALLYIHLSPTTHLKKQIILIDKLGIRHQIDLDQIAFAVQKKATLAYHQITHWMENHDRISAEQGIRDLLHLIASRFQKGIADSDPLIRTNLGFIDHHPVLIDIGPFSKHTQSFETEFPRITASLKSWILTHHPELSAFVEEEVANYAK